MSSTDYPAWPLPTVEPLKHFQQPHVSDAILAQLLTDLVDHDGTQMGLYATWHREAVGRGMIPPYLVCVDDAYPMPVLELHGYLNLNGRTKARVTVELDPGSPMGCLVDTEHLVFTGALAPLGGAA